MNEEWVRKTEDGKTRIMDWLWDHIEDCGVTHENELDLGVAFTYEDNGTARHRLTGECMICGGTFAVQLVPEEECQ